MKTKLVSGEALREAWERERDVDGLLSAVGDAFLAYDRGEVIFPEKSSQVFDESTQDRINCMPATVRPLGLAGVKWVSVFPENPAKRGIPNVGGLMLLSEIESGQPVSVMDAAYLTALRTAAVDALAARYLAPEGAETIAVIGTGEQARFHAQLLSSALPGIREIRISGRTPAHAACLVHELRTDGVPAVDFGSNMAGACSDAHVIVTAISGQAPVNKADLVSEKCLYCHVGGWEDEYGVPLKADKIVCDSWADLKHRGSPTIARMFKEGLLMDADIYCDLADVMMGRKPGREGNEFVYFNAIGLGFVDVAVASWLLSKVADVPTFDFEA